MAHSLSSEKAKRQSDHEDRLIGQYVGPHPSNPSKAEYWLTDPGIPVWAVIGQWKAEGENIDETAAAYHISRVAVEAAVAYYHRHRELIDNRLAENEAA